MSCNLTRLLTVTIRSLHLVKRVPSTTSLSGTTVRRLVSTLTPRQVTEVLSSNEICIENQEETFMPEYIKSIECNQLASNLPIEDRIRVSSFQILGCSEPTVIAAVFDGHGTGITADIVSRRLFNYIYMALNHKKDPEFTTIKIHDISQIRNRINDLYASPPIERNNFFEEVETKELNSFKESLEDNMSVSDCLKTSFIKCDSDLAREIEQNLLYPRIQKSMLNYYLQASLSGCCAIVLMIHQGMFYVASTGDCRAIIGEKRHEGGIEQMSELKVENLSVEHNCDNMDEVQRLMNAHPKTEHSTIIRHNRLLGNLMPFRAFGDFNYKWSVETLRNIGLTKAFGLKVIPTNYISPPYLIVDPEVNEINLKQLQQDNSIERSKSSNVDICVPNRYIVLASDGLWELFDSSRDVVHTIIEHEESMLNNINNLKAIDKNSATHTMRHALRSGTQFEHRTMDSDGLEGTYHQRLQRLLTLPQSIVRNFRDDISLVVIKLK